jgi:putative methyltransferase (TIGR04325 family)
MMKQIKRVAKWALPPILLLPFRSGYRHAPDGSRSLSDVPPSLPVTSFSPYSGNYPDWASAAGNANGYNAGSILEIQRAAMRKVRDGEAVYERDSALFDKIEYFFPTLAALLLIASRNNNRLSVLDFGGALGSSYYQNRAMLAHLTELSWHVVEQPHFVATGQAEFQNAQLRFYPTVGESWAARRPDVVLLSSVLQYLENPAGLLAEISTLGPDYILVDRSPVLDQGPERITVQTVPPDIYPASYACRLFAPGALEALLEPSYEVVFDFEAHVGIVIYADGALARYRGLLFQRRAAKGNRS